MKIKISIKVILFCILTALISVVVSNMSFGDVFYDVTNVQSGDTLTLRELPDFKSKKLSQIPHNQRFIIATGNQKKIKRNTWIELKYNEVVGWVNGRYLKKTQGASFTENLKCLGTEPYWSVDIKDGILVFRDLGNKASEYLVQEIDGSDNHNNKWYLSAISSKNSSIKIFLSLTNKCSDDMSDDKYKYQITLHEDQDKLTLNGCCNRL